MKLAILFFTVAVKCLVFGNSQQDWYKNEVEKNVLPSYIQAYNGLQNGVLNELLTVNVASLDDTAVTQLVNRLYCAVQKVYNFLQQSVSTSEQLQMDVGTRLASSISEESAYQMNITDKKSEIVQTDIALSGALAQLAVAEQAVTEKQRAVAAADQAVRDAEEDVERARKCRGKRGWFSKLTRPIVRPFENLVKDVIIKPICSVINEGGIDSAKSRRGDAHAQLASARTQEQHYRQVVAEKQALKGDLQRQLNQLQSSLVNVQAALQALQSELATTIHINEELKHVTTQLSNVFAGSSVLQDTVAQLIDFELLITPLNAILNAIHQITASGTLTHISESQVQQSKASLAQIALVLPTMPFNLDISFTC